MLKNVMSTNYTPSISVVIPCHNEAEGILHCISRITQVCAQKHLSVEIIVVDNGSTDGTADIARAQGVRVVSEPQHGYGQALRRGFAEAQGEIIVFGDGDGSYDFIEIPTFIALLRDADFVSGERRYIVPGAMPFLHRYVGRPLFAHLIRNLFRVPVKDSHSGFAAIKKPALKKLRLTSTGMEFASEILIQAKRANLRIVSTPITYYPRKGSSKLRTFHDGVRHLTYMARALLSA